MPETLRLSIDHDESLAFRPGDEIRGRAEWSVTATPREAAVHLCWYTRGKGTQDTEIVVTQAFDRPQASDQREFTFRAPEQPYSFSGQLISLIWAVELAIDPAEQRGRVELTIGPNAREIELPTMVPDDRSGPLPTSRVL